MTTNEQTINYRYRFHLIKHNYINLSDLKFHFDFDLYNAESITDSFIQKCQNKVEKENVKMRERKSNGPDLWLNFKQAIHFTVKFDSVYS